MDNFDMAAHGYHWVMDMPASMDPLMPDEMHAMQVEVAIPMNATEGMSDTVTIDITSQGDSGEVATVELTTIAAVTLPGDADLAVTKSAAPAVFGVGDDLVYTLVVANNGPAEATGVILVDTLPAGVTYLTSMGGCTHTGGVVTCHLGDLASTASVTVTITVRVDEYGQLTNTATVSGDQNDPIGGNNTATLITEVTIRKLFLPMVRK